MLSMSKSATLPPSFRSAPRRSPSAPPAEVNSAAIREAKDRGAEMLAQGKLDAALAAFREVVKAAPQEPAHRQKVAEVLQRMGKKPEAITEYQATAELYARAGWMLRAIALCKVILQLEPGHTRTQALLADLYSRQERARAPAPSAPAPATTAMSLPRAPSRPEELAPGTTPIPLFSALGREEFLDVLAHMERRSVQPGELIVKEGAPGNSMFVIVDGEAEVVRQTPEGERVAVARIGEGEFFGEMALLSEGPRLASVVAVEPTVMLELTRQALEEVIARHPSVGEVAQQFYRERLLTNVLRSNPLFAELPEELQRPVIDAFVPITVKAGEQILTRGQPAQALYLLLRGRCTVFHEHVDGRESSYPEMTEGELFGEISLLRSKLVTASVRTATACTLLKLGRESLEQLLAQYPNLRQQLERLGSERLVRTARLLSGQMIHMGDSRV
jgi:cAMP-dependent protein kinase regulator